MPRKKPEPSGRKTPLGRLLENSGIKQNDLSRRSGYTQAYISELVNGVKPMNYRVAKRLGEVLGVDYNFLLYGEEPPKHETVETKIIGTIAAGAPILAEENIEGILPLPTQWARVGDFLLRVKGDSMSPRILDGYVFCTRNGTPVIPRNFDRTFHLLRKKAGIEYVTPHGLRHTFATRLLELDEKMKVVQELLGHSRIGVTADIYSHVTEKLKRRAADKLNQIFKPGTSWAPPGHQSQTRKPPPEGGGLLCRGHKAVAFLPGASVVAYPTW